VRYHQDEVLRYKVRYAVPLNRLICDVVPKVRFANNS
jgi:hypothetical protein